MPGAELTVNEADRSRALKGLTHHKLAPGEELTFQGADDFNFFDPKLWSSGLGIEIRSR